MATNTGSNGGKNNTGNGVIRGATPVDQSRGLGSAINQASYRREYTDKMFSDNGYLNQSINDLKNQSKELDRILEKSKSLSKAEKTRYENLKSTMSILIKQQEEMFKEQEVGSKQLEKSLSDSAKARKKTVDELYKYYEQKESNLNDLGKEQVDNKLRYLASQSKEIEAQAEDIKEATKQFESAKKSFSTGLHETIGDFSKAAGEMSKVLNLQRLASNDYLDKLNEKYEVLNDLNKTLGYGLTSSSKAYNEVFKSYKDFNKNMNGLFNTDDLKSYFSNAAAAGVHNEQLLQDNLESSLIAQKYLGASDETMTSLYKYMKLTNNNDTINQYNKTMIALQRQGVGIAEDTLNQMIQDNTDLSESLYAAGMDSATLEKFNQERNILGAQIATKYNNDDLAKQLNSTVNKVANLLQDPNTVAQVAQMGINVNTAKSQLNKGDAKGLYSTIIGGLNSMDSNNNLDPTTKQWLYKQLGISNDDMYVAKTIGAGGIESLGEVTDQIREKANTMTNQDAKDYVDQNAAISETQRDVNMMNDTVTDLLQNNQAISTTVEKISKTLTYISIGGALINGVTGIAKGINGVYKFFTGNSFGDKLGTFLGKGSGVYEGQMAMKEFAGGGGLAGGALKALGAGTAVVGGTAAVMTLLTGIMKGVNAGTWNSNSEVVSDELKGTKFENDAAYSSAKNVGYTYGKDETNIGQKALNFFGNAGQGTWLGLSKVFNSGDFVSNNKKYWDVIKVRGDFKADEADNLLYAYAFLLNEIHSLKSLSEEGFTEDSLRNYLENEDPSEVQLTKSLVNEMISSGTYLPSGRKGEKPTSVNWDKYYTNGYHLAGLDRVPKDNYRALLHKDEMILNKSQADQYRRLFGEKGYGKGGSLNPSASDYVGLHHSGYSGHSGIDLYFGAIGTPVGSAVAGTVIESRDIPANYNDGKSYHGKDTNGTAYSSYGRVVKVKGDDGHTYIYGHLNERAVKTGDKVSAGTLLGYSGTTGNSSGPHLHFEVAGAGLGEANHARYYTPYVRSANGAAAQSGNVSVSDSSSDSSNSSSYRGINIAKVNTTGTRAVPGLGGIGRR